MNAAPLITGDGQLVHMGEIHYNALLGAPQARGILRFSGTSDALRGLVRDLRDRAVLEHRPLTDFMTLSTWFRDYLYIPLGGSRVAPWRVRLNLFLVFALCGVWHGAGWNFLVWGLWHGAFLSLERTRIGSWLDRRAAPVRHAYALVAVVLGWVLFRAADFGAAMVRPSKSPLYSVGSP